MKNYKLQSTNYLKAQIRNYPYYRSGFTLIEVLVASAILVVLAFGFLSMQYIIGQNQVSVWRNFLSIDATNTAVSEIVKELRNSRESDAGTYPLEVTGDQEIVFYSDYDYDSSVERVRYTLSGNTLTRGIIKPQGSPAVYLPANERTKVVSDIIRNGSNPVFYYYNGEWPEDTVNNPLIPADRISNTRLIKIILKANPKANNSGNDYVLESNVNIRTSLTD